MIKGKAVKVVVSSGILTTMFMGLASFVWAEVRKIPILEFKLQAVEEKQVSTDKKVNEMHWYLIRKNNVQVPQNIKN